MSDDKLKSFILSGMMVFGDKVILPEDAEEIRRKIMSNPLERMIEQELQAAYDRAIADTTKKVTEEVTESVSSRIARNMLMQGDSVDKIAMTTEMSVEAVKQLQAAMA